VVAGVYLIASIVQLVWLYWTNRDSVSNLEYKHS
jgi:hypothetical protein